MNKKGDPFTVFVAVMSTATTLVIILSIALTQSHRIRKANETCIRDGGTIEFCKTKVATMDKKEILEYIRDTVEHPQP